MIDIQAVGTMESGQLIESAPELYEIDEPLRSQLRALMRLRAKDVGIEKTFCELLKGFDKAQKQLAAEYTKQNCAENPGRAQLEYDGRGLPVRSIENYLRVMRYEDFYSTFKYNLLAYAPEYTDEDGKVHRWSDFDDSKSKHFVEEKYSIYDKSKYVDAFNAFCDERKYHPVKELIEGLKWDGTPRIGKFLTTWLKASDTPYTAEVSRLIFAGGINRLYYPGCKFDDVAVLIGTQQGEGKSTIVRWLAMEDKFYSEITTIEGKDGMESLSGTWIGEVSELMAVTRAKEQEAVKAYITRSVDHYRKSYGRLTSDYPRQCIFIGTTNKQQFLSDKTGNRRWYPIIVKSNGYDLYAREKEIKAYIRQCWAEAYAKLDTEEMKPCANMALQDEFKRAQRESMQDDYREGLISSYLENKDRTCVLDLWYNALRNPIQEKPTRKDSDEITLILQSQPYWQRMGSGRFGGVDGIRLYGVQLLWKKIPPKQEEMLLAIPEKRANNGLITR